MSLNSDPVEEDSDGLFCPDSLAVFWRIEYIQRLHFRILPDIESVLQYTQDLTSLVSSRRSLGSILKLFNVKESFLLRTLMFDE